MTIWRELGLEPTVDQKAIRRAYAAQLKTIDIDRDPVAFQRLRAAFEAALARAERLQLGAGEHDDAPETPSAEARPNSEAPAPSRPPSPEEVKERALVDALSAALAVRDVARAYAILDEAMAAAVLPAGEGDAFVQALMALAVDDRSLSAPAFRAIARRFGWNDGVSGDGDRRLRDRVAARLTAEAWYEELLAQAAVPKWGPPFAARLLLGRVPRWKASLVDLHGFRHKIAEYDLHSPWLRTPIDPSHIAWLQRRASKRPFPSTIFMRAIVIGIVFCVLGIVFGLLGI